MCFCVLKSGDWIGWEPDRSWQRVGHLRRCQWRPRTAVSETSSSWQDVVSAAEEQTWLPQASIICLVALFITVVGCEGVCVHESIAWSRIPGSSTRGLQPSCGRHAATWWASAVKWSLLLLLLMHQFLVMILCGQTFLDFLEVLERLWWISFCCQSITDAIMHTTLVKCYHYFNIISLLLNCYLLPGNARVCEHTLQTFCQWAGERISPIN